MKGVHASKEIFGILQESFYFFFIFPIRWDPKTKHTHI